MFMNIIVIIVTICEGVNMFEFSVLNAFSKLKIMMITSQYLVNININIFVYRTIYLILIHYFIHDIKYYVC